MTPAPIGRFMAHLFARPAGSVRVLDPGAGVGLLTAAWVERFCRPGSPLRTAQFVCYEIEPLLLDGLRRTLAVAHEVRATDFVWDAPRAGPRFREAPADAGYTHVILNPPYKKIRLTSAHRAALCQAGLETSNLYTGFLYLAAQRLRPGGEMVALVPRSFCNGPYFRPFREQFFAMMALRHIHVFAPRQTAFKDDAILQENVIRHGVKGGAPAPVTITTSQDGDFRWSPANRAYAAADMTRYVAAYGSVLPASDAQRFVPVPANALAQGMADRITRFTATLADLQLEVSTGPIIDFRLPNDLWAQPGPGTAPRLYPVHVRDGQLAWPQDTRKPNAIRVSTASRPALGPNEGCYVLTRRFATKEEKRRIVATLYESNVPGPQVEFENRLNVFHAARAGLPRARAAGLAVYLNSRLVDRYFRQFNGHTQVNAADLRALPYPSRATLERWGQAVAGGPPAPQAIEALIEEEVCQMSATLNLDPLRAQQKIEEALSILKALGLPRAQRNTRSALTLLALLNLRADGIWTRLERPRMGITPIMDFMRRHYGPDYAPHTRETIRRQTMHQFVAAALALRNPPPPRSPRKQSPDLLSD